MVSVNPFAEFYTRCETILKDALNKLYPNFSLPCILLEVPPNLEFGELAASVCFELAKNAKKKPRSIAEEIVNAIDISDSLLIESVHAAGAGYINFRINSETFSRLTLESARALDQEYRRQPSSHHRPAPGRTRHGTLNDRGRHPL